MKKILFAFAVVGVLSLSLGGASAVLADTSTSTAAMEGHPRPYLAGSYDSIHNKGAWCESNVFPFYRTIFYVAEGTANGASCNFAQVFAAMNYK